MKSEIFKIDSPKWISQALSFANRFDTFCYLNPNHYQHGFHHTLAIGVKRAININSENAFESLKQFHATASSTIFGYLSYDLKNQIEVLNSSNHNFSQFPLLSFFEPEIIIQFSTPDEIEITAISPLSVFKAIADTDAPLNAGVAPIEFSSRTTKDDYFINFKAIQQHIVEGDIYELNYCIEFYKEQAQINSLDVYRSLNKLSPSPYSSLFKTNELHIISTSPERFLKKVASKVISQPMKGTATRSDNPIQDIELKNKLQNSEKERAENLMIVDLVRHDLSHYATKGSVAVDELFGIYSFPKVHQMISTISMEVQAGTSPIDVIQKAFPMGSMTGAPKIMAMQLIDRYENYQRNVFSGALGYITPNGDFDFNVLIRSLFYNTNTNYLSFSAGSAITYDANAEDEYNECLLKANSVAQCFKK